MFTITFTHTRQHFAHRLCDPIEKSVNNELDVSNFFESLASNFAGVVQYNKDNSPHATVTIDDVCDIMINTKIGAQIDRLAAVNKLLLDQSNQTCLDYKYDNMIKLMQNTSWDAEEAVGGGKNGVNYAILLPSCDSSDNINVIHFENSSYPMDLSDMQRIWLLPNI